MINVIPDKIKSTLSQLVEEGYELLPTFNAKTACHTILAFHREKTLTLEWPVFDHPLVAGEVPVSEIMPQLKRDAPWAIKEFCLYTDAKNFKFVLVNYSQACWGKSIFIEFGLDIYKTYKSTLSALPKLDYNLLKDELENIKNSNKVKKDVKQIQDNAKLIEEAAKIARTSFNLSVDYLLEDLVKDNIRRYIVQAWESNCCERSDNPACPRSLARAGIKLMKKEIQDQLDDSLNKV